MEGFNIQQENTGCKEISALNDNMHEQQPKEGVEVE